MEIEHSHPKRWAPQKLFYPHPSVSPQNDRQMLQLYLKDRTFSQAIDAFRQLDLEEIHKLKIIVDQLYQKYQENQMTLTQIQGLWPLLTFIIPNINGLQIYLYFQYLITPVQVKHINTQVKQQQRQFDPQAYFQNSKWIYKRNFVQTLRVLQRQLTKATQEQNIKSCLKLLQFASIDNYEYIMAGKDFRDSYQNFKAKLKKQFQSKRIIAQSSAGPLFNDRLFKQEMILSEPDMMHNTLLVFTKQEYIHYHTTNTMIQIYKPIQQQPPIPNGQSEDSNSEYQSTITIKERKTSVAPTKRRLERQKTNLDTPIRRRGKPLPRIKMVQRLFELDNKKNKVLEQIKKTRKRQQKQKKRKKRLQKIRKQINYFSDDEEEKKQKHKKKQKTLNNKMHLQSQPQSRRGFSNKSHHQQQFIDDSESQSIVMRKRKLHKKPIYDFDYQLSQQEQKNIFYPTNNKNRMVIDDEDQVVIHNKNNQYQVGKIKIVQLQYDNRIMQKLANLQITKLQLNQGGYGMMNQFDFGKYRRLLSYLQPKEIKQQIQKIIKQTILRQQVPFDIDLALKIMAVWTVLSQSKQLYQNQMTRYINPLLRYIFGVNFYRCVCEILNNSLDWGEDHHLNQLKRAYGYFSTLFEVGRNFISLGLQNQLMDIFYSFIITPNKYQKLSKNMPFFSQSTYMNLKNPYKIAHKNLKFKLEENQEKISFFVCSLIMQVLFICRFVDRNLEKFKIRQRQFLKNIKNQLAQLKDKYDAQWFYSLTNTVKKFYLIYRPYLTKEYFLVIVSLLNSSLQRLILQSITTDNDQQSNNQISFLIQLVTDYGQTRWNQPLKPNHLTILNELTLQTKFKQNYGNLRSNATATMIYSSILLSLISNPIFKTDQAMNSVFLKYLKEYIQPDLSNIISSLKSNIYEPVFELIREIYQYKVNKKLLQLNGNDDNTSHEEITKVLVNLWEAINHKHDELTRLLQQRLRPKSNQSFLQKDNCEKQIVRIKDKLQKCSQGLQLFLKYYIICNENSTNPLSLSASHYFFRLQFSIKFNYFIKYLNQSYSNDLKQSILQNISFLLKNPRYNERRYTSIIVQSFNTAIKHKQIQYHNILRQDRNPLVQQAIAVIHAANMTSAAEQLKYTQVSPPENTIIKFIKENIEGTSIAYDNIQQSVSCLNYYLAKLATYVQQKQINQNEVLKIKNYFWQYFFVKYMKEIVLLVFLGGFVQNYIENKNSTLKELIFRLRALILIPQNSLKTQKDLGYIVFLQNLQRLREYNSITDILSEVISYRQQVGLNKTLQKGVQSLMLDVVNSFKKTQKCERQKSPITIQCIRILIFLLEWPGMQIDSIKPFLKDMQVISNAQSLITQIRINQTNISVLLRFFQIIQQRETKVYGIHQTMHIFITKVTELPNPAARDNYCKKIKRILASIRQCLKKDIRLKKISSVFLKSFLKSFCSSQNLNLQNKQVGVYILQVYLQMMKNSLLERSIYQQLIIQDRKRFQILIPKLMSRVEKQDSHLYQTFQSTILTCMIGRYSDLYDIKRLIGAIKREEVLSSTKKKNITSLLQKLRKTAIEVGNHEQIVQWCNNEAKSLEKEDDFADWMDLQ